MILRLQQMLYLILQLLLLHQPLATLLHSLLELTMHRRIKLTLWLMTFLYHLQELRCNIVGMITNITTVLLHHLVDQRHTTNQRIIDTWTIDLLIKSFEALGPLQTMTALGMF